MNKIFQKFRKWVCGLLTIQLLVAGLAIPVSVSATDPANTIVTVDSKITTDNTPEITGTVSDIAVTIKVYFNTRVTGYDATNNGDGTWTLADNTVASLPNAVHDVIAITSDGAEDTTTDELIVDSDSPSASITSPESGAYVGGLVAVKAKTWDLTPTRTQLEVSSGDVWKSIYDENDERLYDDEIVYAWDTKEYEDGPYTLRLTAYDHFGKFQMSLVSVVVDNTAPKVLTATEHQSQLATSLATTAPVIADEGVYILEESKNVTVESQWNLISTKVGDDATYEVVYIATDLAGNVGISNPVIVSLKQTNVKKGTLPLSKFELKLGDIKDQERNETYLDLGVKIHDWTTDYVNVWAFGDLDTSKVGSYKFGYKAAETTPAPDVDEPVYITRNVDVVDTVGPGAVRNLTATAGYGYVQLNWKNPIDIDGDLAGLSVKRADSKGGKWEEIAIIENDATSFDDYDVVNGHTYYYTVVAYDIYGNNSKAAQKVSATPKAPKVVSAAYTSYDSGDKPIVDQDVKADDTEKEDTDTKTKSAVPVVGIIILVLLIALGLYLLYLQNPEMFSKLAFWKRNKKGSLTIGSIKYKKNFKTKKTKRNDKK